MTITHDTVQWNTRERALSTDQNRQAALVSRNITEGVAALASGTLRRSGCFGNSFLVTPVAGTMTCTVSAGTALIYNQAQVYPDSTVQWIQSTVLREVTIEAADVLTRFDIVEMRAGSEVSSSQPRDQFNPVTGTFTVVNMNKELRSRPDIRVVKGTPGASPHLPAPDADSVGWMPLAYVRVVGGELTLDPDNVIYCRPIINAEVSKLGWMNPAPTTFSPEVTGGNIEIVGGDLTGQVSVDMTGRFPGFFHNFLLSRLATVKLGSMVYDGGGLPASDGTIYFYAAPAPYPSGYDASMAGREFWTPSTVNTYGTSGGFYSTTRQSGCIVVASSVAPGLTPSGAPTAGGTALFTHELFGSGLATASNRANWMYIGSSWYDIGTGSLLAQNADGATVAPYRKTGADLSGLLPILGDTTISLASQQGADPTFTLPTHVRQVHLLGVHTLNAAGFIYMRFRDSLNGSPGSVRTFTAQRAAAMTASIVGVSTWIKLSESQTFIITQAQGDQLGPGQAVFAHQWLDPVLAMRQSGR